MKVLHYFTTNRHGTLHRFKEPACMACKPNRVASPARAKLIVLEHAHHAYSAGAKVCMKCFPEGLPVTAWLDAEEEGRHIASRYEERVRLALVPPPSPLREQHFRSGETNVVAAQPCGGNSMLGNVAHWIGQEAVAGRFYLTMDDALDAYAKKLSQKG